MAEFVAPHSTQEYEANFEQLKPLMNDTQAYYESSRCLFCYDAPCIKACPTGIDIPLFIRQINSGNAKGAAETIYHVNWFGYACGKVCPTEVLCEGACVYNHQDVKPIEIGRLQSYATGSSIKKEQLLFKPAADNGKTVAVIGAGPAGISAACELRMLGFTVEIFEGSSQPSGLTVHGVAPYKITNEEVLDEMAWLQKQFGYKVHYNSRIDSSAALKKLEEQFDLIFLGIGLGATALRGLPGEELDACVGAVEFVAKLRAQKDAVSVPKRVVVIGGGNTAMDVASEAARMGAEEVSLVYRRSKEAMSAYDFEYDLAKGVGVKGIFNATPLSIENLSEIADKSTDRNTDRSANGHTDEKKLRVRFERTATIDGKLQSVTDSEFSIDCELVIRATGQEKQLALFELIDGLELDRSGCIKTNADFQTSNPRYFAAGDAVNGGAEVVNAAAEAKLAAHGMLRYCFPNS